MLVGGTRQRAAVAEVFDHLGDGALERHVGGLIADDFHRVGDGDTGLDEDGQLTREVHQLFLLHLHGGELELQRAALLLDLHRVQVLIEQERASSADGVGFGQTFNGRAAGVDGCVCKLGHAGSPMRQTRS